jgi:RNA polymerase sigma-70 factor (ECF subfamily)
LKKSGLLGVYYCANKVKNMRLNSSGLLLELKTVPNVCQEEIIALQRCRRGSAEAFEVLVNRYMKDAYFIALGLVGNREDALDLSQEAFIRAYRNIKNVKPGRKFFPWFYQILKNLCVSHLRKRRYRQASSLDADGCPEVAATADCFLPEAVARRNEMKEKVWQAIGKLNDKHREVIILRHFRNMSYDQIAEVLFCNKGTVTSRLYYARKKLEELLGTVKGGSINDMP